MNVPQQTLFGMCVVGSILLTGPLVELSSAHACSVPCPRIAISLEDAVVPANATGATIRGEYGITSMIDERYSLVNLDSGEFVIADVSFQAAQGADVTFLYPLDPDTPYQLSAPESCDESITSIEFTTAQEAPFPSSLGTLEVSPRQLGELQVSESAGCDMTAEAAYYDLTLHLDDEALPWDEALVYETYVDGEIWEPTSTLGDQIRPGYTWMGRHQDRVFTLCDVDDSVYQAEEGLRTVEIQARHAGRDEILATESITIDLHCGPIEESASDSSSDSSESGGCSTTNTSPVPLALLTILPLLVLTYRRHPSR